MRIPAKAELPDLQESFRELFTELDSRPDFDLKGRKFDNSGDSVSDRSLVALSQVSKFLATLKARKVAFAAEREVTGDNVGDILGFRFARQSFDLVTSNSTTLVDMPGLSIPIGNGECWVALLMMLYNANSTFSARVSVNAPTYSGNGVIGSVQGTATTLPAFDVIGNPVGVIGVSGDNLNLVTCTLGIALGDFVPSVGDGTAQFQAAQLTGGVYPTTFYADSILYAFRVL